MDLDLVWHSSEARIALVPPVSVKDRPLYWILVGTQTYYSEHILAYGGRKIVALLSWVLALSRLNDWRRRWWRSKHHIKSETQEWRLGVQVWIGTWTP